jgi:hypothetical protein
MDQKPWYQSRAIWGSAVAIGASLLKLSGHELPSELQGQAVDLILNAVTLIGGAIALYGRVKASTTIGKKAQ